MKIDIHEKIKQTLLITSIYFTDITLLL
jgi:hypothetical protein